MGPLYLFRVAVLRTLLTAGFVRRGRGLQYRPAREKNMQQQFFFYADLPITPTRLERFEPFLRSGSRYNLNGRGYYANIYDTVQKRLVWEGDFNTDEDARIALVCEHLMLASIASRPRHIQ